MAESGASPLPPAPPAHSPLFRAEQFVWLTARVLEQRLFAYHFLNGSADPVDTALDAYRNEDGGYGHALDPDLRGPVSQPLHSGHALRVLDAIGRCGGQRVERVCRYLTSVSTPDGALPATDPRQRGYPAAPSWTIVQAPPSSLLATGPVVGLLHRNEVWHAWLFRATDFCWQAVESLEKSHPQEVRAAVAFLDAAPDRPRAEAVADRLGRMVRDQRLAALDPERDIVDTGPSSPGSTPGGAFLPHDFAATPRSLARAWFTEAEISRSLDHLAGEQREDGGWPSRRQRWAPGVGLEARPMATIDALRTLRAYGRHIG
ncbi:hypothetical protein SZN_04024 [Streptomyces zinciresistens K42]|uniref:Uncharacterized protein n=1 Tax=Streptomyces zinciresistens K42 TaxID=700597 RepID=G2G5Q1_9ACTN|nr:hypothetical protein [Streptomyces zinciresistens]EGX61218.1 hypothetical protein SZN_04024 [Streptomyces zinciresistens K42]